RLNSTGTEALATELRLRQEFNNARIVNIMNREIEVLFQLLIRALANRTSVDRSELIIWSQLKLCKKYLDEVENQDDDRRNRKLAPEYAISGYNSLALSIALLAVSLDKRKKVLVLVKNKDDNRKIFKIVQKGKTKILGKHYCNIPLANPNQFEIKKCKGYSGNTAKMTRKVDKEKRTSKKFKSESPTNSLNEGLFQSLSPIKCLEIELLKKQKLSEALERANTLAKKG
ncbi:24423_t:CDS:2, partial [Gigaspora margarita]